MSPRSGDASSSGQETQESAVSAAKALEEEAKIGRLVALGRRALYLIDDPFSPLDAATGMAVWRAVFATGGRETPKLLSNEPCACLFICPISSPHLSLCSLLDSRQEHQL